MKRAATSIALGSRSARNAVLRARWAATRSPKRPSGRSSPFASIPGEPSGVRLKILVVGGGPAGLYFAYLAKRQAPDWDIQLLEQNPPDATFGFGVVFSDKALEFLRADDASTYDLVTPHMEAWTDLTVVHRGTPVVIDGVGFAAIGRLPLLRLLQKQAASVGIAPQFHHPITEER